MGCKSGSMGGGLLGNVIVTVSGLNWTDLTTADSRLLFEEGLDSCLILDFMLDFWQSKHQIQIHHFLSSFVLSKLNRS